MRTRLRATAKRVVKNLRRGMIIEKEKKIKVEKKIKFMPDRYHPDPPAAMRFPATATSV